MLQTGAGAALEHSVASVHNLASVLNLNGTGHYVHWGFIQISVANLVVIGLMLIVFAAAIAIPFRRRREHR